MIRRYSKPHTQTRWRLLLGILCLALVVLGSTVQVAHSHPSGEISHADCSLCATAHVVAQAVSHPVALQATLVVTAVQGFILKPPAIALSVFALFTRPPPAVSTAA
jgi:hypothetical protein